MASIGRVTIGERYESDRSVDVENGKVSVEYTDPFTFNGELVMRHSYWDLKSYFWIKPDMRENILAVSKAHFSDFWANERMTHRVPVEPGKITATSIERAYIFSFIDELTLMRRREKEYKKLSNMGYPIVGFKGTRDSNGYKDDDMEATLKQMDEDKIPLEARYFSINDFNPLEDFDYSTASFDSQALADMPEKVRISCMLSQEELKKLGLSGRSTEKEMRLAIHRALRNI